MNRSHLLARSVSLFPIVSLAAAVLGALGCAAPVSSEPSGNETFEALVFNPLNPFGIVSHTVTGDVMPGNLTDKFDESPPLFGAQIYEYDFKLDPFDIATHSATISTSSEPVWLFVQGDASAKEAFCKTRQFTMSIARYVPGYVLSTPWGGKLNIEPTWVDIATLSASPRWRTVIDSAGNPSRGVCTVDSLAWTGVIQHLSAIRATVTATLGNAQGAPVFLSGSVAYSGTSQ